jgi:16S rRNA (cytidine1402-2'-O)-methyltransferase
MKGVLYLVPNTLGNPDPSTSIPPAVAGIVKLLMIFVVESVRYARRYLKSIDREIDIDALTFHELNVHTALEEVPEFLTGLLNGSDTALISDAGVPGVADPGAILVRLAHERGIRVVPLTGPSSILLSLMASGLNGQAFRFLGYLPVKKPERIRGIREMEQVMKKTGETQVFIEAPYRNDALLSDLLKHCEPTTRLCIAAEISLENEMIRTMTVKEWKRQPPTLHKIPAIFLIGK